MRVVFLVSAAAISLAVPAFAQDASGDPEKGAREFNKCKACHSIVDASGEAVVKGGKVGPNLYGVVGRKAGSVEDFNYSESMVAAGEAGLNWDLEHFIPYVADPTGFLRGYLEDDKARGKMIFKLNKEEDAQNVWAYIASVSE
ncbi:c-type cytochrome [Heliomarina baculiformis]|uniref:c-type cytochrome n=1 Tax=Heliomarina baculiformis TaxID=2872036 RepID=UPI001EE3593A|nr:c-type cytochrome [Heliomarina baculiformis]